MQRILATGLNPTGTTTSASNGTLTSQLCGRRLARQTAKHSRGQKAIAGQITRRCRARNAGRRATSRKQIWKHYAVLALDAAGGIDRETALGMKQRAGNLDRMERRLHSAAPARIDARNALARLLP